MRTFAVGAALLTAVIPGLVAAAANPSTSYVSALAMLGVATHPAPLTVQAQTNLQPGDGLVVWRVRPGSPAEQMGIQPGDVITNVNGVATGTRAALRTEVRSNQPGDPVTVQLARGPERTEVSGVLGERPAGRPFRPYDSSWDEQIIDWQRQYLAAAAAVNGAFSQDFTDAQQWLASTDPKTWTIITGSGFGTLDPAMAWAFAYSSPEQHGGVAAAPVSKSAETATAVTTAVKSPGAPGTEMQGPWQIVFHLGASEVEATTH